MKKNKTFTTLLVSSLMLVGALSSCSNNENNHPTPSPIDKELVDSVYFTELYHGDNINDCAVELSANVDTDISKLTINFYRNEEITKKLSLKNEKTLKKNETLVIMNKDFKNVTDVEGRTIQLEDNFIFNCFYFEIVDEYNRIVDSIGNYGFNLTNCYEESLIRLPDFFKARPVYRELDFIRVRKEGMKYLGNLKSPVTLEKLLKGPVLDETRYGNLNFTDENGLPTGGYNFVRIAKNGLGDGDTTQFDWPKESGISNGYKSRVRYLLCDTPEIYHGPNSNVDPEPFGNEAQRFNNVRLKNATKIIVQSNKGYSTRDTYGRTLGYVWYTDVKNPKISDFKLLNFEIVLAGLARATFRERYETMYSNDILYSDYIKYGYQLAIEKGIKIHGEIDPEFNY